MNKTKTVFAAFLVAALLAGSGIAAARPDFRPEMRTPGSYEEALRLAGDSPMHFKLWDSTRTFVLEGTYGNGAYVGTLLQADAAGALTDTGRIAWGGYHGTGKPFGAFWGFVGGGGPRDFFHGWFGRGTFAVTNLSGGFVSGHYAVWTERPA